MEEQPIDEYRGTAAQSSRRVGVLGSLGMYPLARVSGPGRRLLAHLAIRGPREPRTIVYSDLWPDLTEKNARASLRRALWQLPRGWISVEGQDLALQAAVDLTEARSAANRAIQGQELSFRELDLLKEDVLPGWYEDWLLRERETFHLLRLQALEAACLGASIRGNHALATQAGLAAVTAEPLRESAVSALVSAHLAEGNRFEAVKRYRSYAILLRKELGATPGHELVKLFDDVMVDAG